MSDSPMPLDRIRFNSEGLVPAIAQDRSTGRVLMLAWANREAVQRTLESGDAHFWSRSRKELWRKGATSGHVLRNTELRVDCDGDTLLMMVDPAGPACHTGQESCFDEADTPVESNGESKGEKDSFGAIEQLWKTLESRAAERPEGSYTTRLLDDANLRYKKLGEETTELVVALTTGDTKGVAEEAADLIYHVLAALLGAGVSWSEVRDVLDQRRR